MSVGLYMRIVTVAVVGETYCSGRVQSSNRDRERNFESLLLDLLIGLAPSDSSYFVVFSFYSIFIFSSLSHLPGLLFLLQCHNPHSCAFRIRQQKPYCVRRAPFRHANQSIFPFFILLHNSTGINIYFTYFQDFYLYFNLLREFSNTSPHIF